MEYNDLVELYKIKLLKRYKQCQGEKHMENAELSQIQKDVLRMSAEEKRALLEWIKEELLNGSP